MDQHIESDGRKKKWGELTPLTTTLTFFFFLDFIILAWKTSILIEEGGPGIGAA